VGVGTSKRSSILRHRIEIWRETPIGTQKPHPVGTRCVERDEDDVRMGSTLLAVPEEAAEKNQKAQTTWKPHKKKGVYHRRTPPHFRQIT